MGFADAALPIIEYCSGNIVLRYNKMYLTVASVTNIVKSHSALQGKNLKFISVRSDLQIFGQYGKTPLLKMGWSVGANMLKMRLSLMFRSF